MAIFRPPTAVYDYIARDQIEDLWSAGFTIVARSRHPDPFHVPAEMVPQGRRYQWWHLVHDRIHFERPKEHAPSGWAPVPASRHDGYFMPFGHRGDIEVGGLGLFEKSAFEVQQELNANTAAAHKQVSDWAEKAGAELSGSVTVGGVKMLVGDQAQASVLFMDPEAKTIETTVSLPQDMLPHMAEVFAERDRLYAELQEVWDNPESPIMLTEQQEGVISRYHEALASDPSILKGPAFNALLLPHAIANVRAKLKEGKTDE